MLTVVTFFKFKYCCVFCWGGGEIFIFGKPLSDQTTAQLMNILLDLYSMKYIAT